MSDQDIENQTNGNWDDQQKFWYTTTTTGANSWTDIKMNPGTVYPVYQNSTYTISPPKPCRLCGKENPNVILVFPDICPECMGKVMDKVMSEIIPKTEEYCQECFSHINACRCEKKAAMDKLKK